MRKLVDKHIDTVIVGIHTFLSQRKDCTGYKRQGMYLGKHPSKAEGHNI